MSLCYESMKEIGRDLAGSIADASKLARTERGRIALEKMGKEGEEIKKILESLGPIYEIPSKKG